MTLKFKIIFSLTLVFNFNTMFGQTKDTVINSVHYNYIDKWDGNKLRVIGNYKDSIKQGVWTYFHRDGTIAGCGTYKDGKKTGKWKYHCTNFMGSFKGILGIKYSRKKINWNKKKFINENNYFDKDNGYYIIIDNETMTSPRHDHYWNGKHMKYIDCKGG